jgi:hypothetical protein
VKAKLSFERIAKELRITPEGVRMKALRLGLEVRQLKSFCSTSSGDLPKELFTVEQVLLFLARAIKSLEQSGLGKDGALWLRSLVQA